MKRLRLMLVTVVALTGVMISGPVLAHGGRGGGGAHFSSGRVGGSAVAGSRFSGAHVGGSSFSASRGIGARFGGGHFSGSHFRSRVGIVLTAPLFPAWYFYPPPPPWYYDTPAPAYYYEDPSAYAAPSPAPGYTEQGYVPAPSAQPPAAQQPSSWYYCPSAKTYYPYVKECPEGWQQVAPQAPPS